LPPHQPDADTGHEESAPLAPGDAEEVADIEHGYDDGMEAGASEERARQLHARREQMVRTGLARSLIPAAVPIPDPARVESLVQTAEVLGLMVNNVMADGTCFMRVCLHGLGLSEESHQRLRDHITRVTKAAVDGMSDEARDAYFDTMDIVHGVVFQSVADYLAAVGDSNFFLSYLELNHLLRSLNANNPHRQGASSEPPVRLVMHDMGRLIFDAANRDTDRCVVSCSRNYFSMSWMGWGTRKLHTSGFTIYRATFPVER
jgi:hypothetical protein